MHPEAAAEEDADNSSQAFNRSIAIGAAIAFIPFIWSLTGGHASLLRTARPDGLFSNFFDLQAEALLAGHFDVPAGALGIEGFVIGGRTYMYFPPFPSLLRMPVLAFWPTATGQLTAPSMLLGWVCLVLGLRGLLWELRVASGRQHRLTRSGVVLTALFVAAVCGGSPIVYLASMPWAYHEVYLWSISTAVLAAWAAARFIAEPSWRRAVDLTVFVSASILTRTTVGFGCAVMALGCALVVRRRTFESGRRAWPFAVIAAAVPLALACTVTWVKFGSPLNFLPLDAQRWTQVNEQRRLALAANRGRLTNINYLPTTIYTYFNPTGVRLIARYPYVTLPARVPKVFGDAYFDQTYRTGSITAFAPLPVLSALFAVAHLARRWRTGLARGWPLVLGMSVAMAGVLNYGFMAHRYLGDLVPFFVVAGAFGIVALAHAMPRRQSIRVGFVAVAALLTTWGILANTLVASAAAARTEHGDAIRTFVHRQLTWSPPGATFVQASRTLPASGDAESVVIVGDCDALAVATGDQYQPWIIVGGDGHVATVDLPSPGTTELFPFVSSSGDRTIVVLERSPNGQVRLVLEGAMQKTSMWSIDSLVNDSAVDVAVGFDAATSTWLVSLDYFSSVRVPASGFDNNWFETYTIPDLKGKGDRVTWTAMQPDALCTDARDHVAPTP